MRSGKSSGAPFSRLILLAIIEGLEIEGAASGVLRFGGIAQLGERLHGMQEVSGSIPLTSTKMFQEKRISPRF
jgi:hypothetical protein